MLKKITLLCTFFLLPNISNAVFMDNNWAKSACDGWNKNNTLTTELAEKWVKNDKNRGYKIVQIYRDECGEKSKIQMNISSQGGKAMCVYAGAPDGKALDMDVDYVMHATDEDWTCIGKGSFGCGAMGAMATGKLKFTGPKLEAMSVMGPFEEFLLLTGKIAGAKGKANCQ